MENRHDHTRQRHSLLAQKLFGFFDNMVNGKSKFFHDNFARCGSAKMINADNNTLFTNPFFPAKGQACFNSHPFLDIGR